MTAPADRRETEPLEGADELSPPADVALSDAGEPAVEDRRWRVEKVLRRFSAELTSDRDDAAATDTESTDG
jgi:hypothetical protein